MADAQPFLAAGAMVAGKYRVARLIGGGGMAWVYAAKSIADDGEVALKIPHLDLSEDPSLLARFAREARSAETIKHPNAIKVLEVVQDELGLPVLVMELLHGQDLRQRIAKLGRLSLGETARIMVPVLGALADAHAQGIVHRDLKPENIFLSRHLGEIVPKVVDFGIAKRFHTGLDAASLQLTKTGSMMGTPYYMAPEQVAARPVFDHRVDVWAIGVVLYEMLGGERPFQGEVFGQIFAAIMADEPAPLRARAPELPDRVSDLVHRCLAKAAANRPGSAGEIAEVLTAYATLPVVVYPKPGHTVHRVEITTRPALPAPAADEWSQDTAPAPPPPPPGASVPQPPPIASAPTPSVTATVVPGRRTAVSIAAVVLLCVSGAAGTLLLVNSRHAIKAQPPPRSSAPPATVLSVRSSRRLTFDRGCEEYPSFFPDGHTVAFDGVVDGNYDLMTLDLDTGDRRRVTTDPSWDYGAAVSPDGKAIAYLHLADDGYVVRLGLFHAGVLDPVWSLGVASGFPTWTSDGAMLVGTSDGQVLRFELSTKAPTRSVARRLPDGLIARYLAASSDGRIAAFLLRNAEDTRATLGEIRPDGTVQSIETDLRTFQAGLLPSPSGRSFYYVRPAATEGNELVNRGLDDSIPPVMVPGGVSPRSGVTISRDGKRLVYSTCEDSLAVMNLDTGKPPIDLVPSGRWHDNFPVRVDAHRLLITSDRSGVDQVWLFDTVTQQVNLLTGPNTREGASSPDGRSVVYSDRANRGIYLIPTAGGPPRRLTEGTDFEPKFSYDGHHVVFMRSDHGSRIFSVPTEGGTARPIGPATAESLAASPAEDRVIFLRRVEHGVEVMSTTVSGAAPHPLRDDLPIAEYSSPRFSPDGKRLLLVRKHTEAIEIDIAGSAPPVLRWKAGLEAIDGVDYAPDGDGFSGSLVKWDGDLWLVEGTFP